MKRFSIYIILSVAALFAAGCVEDIDIEQKLVEFTALTDHTETKTELDRNLDVLWQEDDEITIFYGSDYNSQFLLKTGAGTTEGCFLGVDYESGEKYDGNYAIYPYSYKNEMYDEETVKLYIDYLQPYKKGGFAKEMNPMVAKTADTDDFTLRFRNVCGLVKVSILGNEKITGALLSGYDDEPLGGMCRVNVDDMTVTMEADASSYVYVYDEDGIQLDPEVPTDIWFVVPPTVFENGLYLYLTDMNDKSMYCMRFSKTEVKRNKVISMATVTYVPQDDSGDDPGDDPGDDDGWQGVLETGWEEKTFLHRSVAMRFTADWCGFCPIMAKGFELAKEQLPNNLEVISMHASGGLYFSPCEELLNYYGITGFPTGVVDGREFVYNTSEETIAEQTVELVHKAMSEYETTSGVSWVSKINQNKVRVDLAVYLKKSGSYKITALAVEDNIVGYQAGEGDSYVHNEVPRIAFTSIFGDGFTTTKDNEAVKYTYECGIPAGCNADNMRIVVYIHEYDKGSGLVDDYHIDNSASGRMGESLSLGLISDGEGGTEDIEQGEDIEM